MELVVAIVLLGTLAGIAVPSLATARDRASVRSATSELVAALSEARHAAIATSRRVAIHFDSASARVLVLAAADTLGAHLLGRTHGVRLASTRDSIAYAANGLGWGGANVTVTLRRGRAADTVVVARTGRVRH